MKRNFKKRFRGLFLTVSLAACVCGNHVVESKSFRTDIAKLVLLIASGLVINLKSEKMAKKFMEDKIDEFSKKTFEKLDEDKQKNNQKVKKERAYEKVARILKDYLEGMAKENGKYRKILIKLASHYFKLDSFQNMGNKNLGTANIIWCFLSLKYYQKFDSTTAQKDERIQEDLLKIINDIIDVVINAISGKIDNEMLKNVTQKALTGLSDPLKKYIKNRAAIDGNWITATSGFLGAVQALSDMPPFEKIPFYYCPSFAKKLYSIEVDLCNVGQPNAYKFENYTKEDFWKGWENYY